MGNKPCRIAIRIDEPQRAHRAGEVVAGRVYLSATSSKDDLSCFQGINLVLEGHEEVLLSSSSSESKYDFNRRVHENDPHVERSTKVLVRTEYPIAHFHNGGLKSGQYEYPFQWRLPADLPSSMHCGKRAARNVYNFGEIKYTLSARIVMARRTFDSVKNNATKIDSLNLTIVSSGSSMQGQPIPEQSEDYPINTCFFWRNGSIRLGWDAASDVCFPDSTLSVNVFGENQSAIPVRSLTVKLVETVHVHTSQQAMKKSFSHAVAEQTLQVDGVECWKSRDQRRHQLAENMLLTHLFDLRIPSNVRDTYRGDLIQVQHTLVITAETPGLCTITSPESSYQIHVARQGSRSGGSSEPVAAVADPPMNPNYQHEFADAEILPPDWSPVVANDVVVIPEACAVVMDEDIHDARVVSTTSSRGLASASLFRDDDNQRIVQASAPPSAPIHDMTAPDFSQLLELVAVCPENLAVVLEGDDMMTWRNLVQNLKPRDYCTIIRRSQTPVTVATTLARYMNFKTRHLLACWYALEDPVERVQVLRQVAPLTTDLQENMSCMENELSPQELAELRSVLQS